MTQKKKKSKKNKKDRHKKVKKELFQQSNLESDGSDGSDGSGQRKMTATEQQMLRAHLEGKVSLSKRQKATRTNWDTPKNSALRERIRVSWEKKATCTTTEIPLLVSV